MKVFIADKQPKGRVSDTDYHWCDNNDLLMFGQFQLGNGNLSEVAMCGTKTRKFTTHILVNDIDIPKDFYKELIIESIERSMDCTIDRNTGVFNVDIAWGFHLFNVNDIMKELLEKASVFDDGEKVICFGRTLSKI